MPDGTEKKQSRAFIIGDKDRGLTIVITDPVMVAHYSIEDLKNASINQMAGKEPIVAMAAVAQELMPFLRGVDLDTLRQRESQMRSGARGDFGLADEESLFAELNYAATIGRIIRNHGTVCDVDFCLALDIDSGSIIARGRSTGPAIEIKDYLKQHAGKTGAQRTVPADPQTFIISNLPTDNLSELDPWTDPVGPPKDP